MVSKKGFAQKIVHSHGEHLYWANESICARPLQGVTGVPRVLWRPIWGDGGIPPKNNDR